LTADGEIRGTYYYDAFGNILEVSGNADNPIRYAGYMYDEETGLYYLNARYYDPKIARFLSEDTYRGTPDDPLSLNLYTYCNNNPIKYYDPTGHILSEWDEANIKDENDRNDILKYTKMWEYYDSVIKEIKENMPKSSIERSIALREIESLKKMQAELHKKAEDIRDKYRKSNEIPTGDGNTIIIPVSPTTRKSTDNISGSGYKAYEPYYFNYYQDMNNNGIPDDEEPCWVYIPRGNTISTSTIQPEGNNRSFIENLQRKFEKIKEEFVLGIIAGALESVTFGASRELEVYYDRENEIIYLIGKVVGNAGVGIVSGIGTIKSGAAAIVTSPTGVGAVAFGEAAIYLGTVTVSAVGNATYNISQIVSKASSGRSSRETDKNVFPEDPKSFNPEGLIRKEYNNGKIIKWHDPKTGKAIYEWNADPIYGDHYHITPDGKNRIPHPDTGDIHIKPGERIPEIKK